VAGLKVVRNEVDGWDVVREDEDVALSNHPTRESAEAAAGIRADEERVGDEGGTDVEVKPDEVHGIDDAEQGMKPAFLTMGSLLVAIAVLIVVIALIAALTDFGS